MESYLNILKRRFGERFRCRIDVEPEAMDLRIPKLVLQPMIENAVKYGFGKQLNLTVELKAYIHEGKLIMICRDDGVGIPQGTLSELIALLEDGPDFLDRPDTELCGALVAEIIVESNDTLRFLLHNGLELRESIERTVR